MKINRALNLVVPVELENGMAYVHSTPIAKVVFEEFYLVISKTFTRIFSEGLGAVGGARIAHLMLKETAGNDLPRVQQGLINEIFRLSNVLTATPNGWKSLPLQTAVDSNVISEDDLSEIMGELVFFMCVSSVNKKSQIEDMMSAVNGLWGSSTTQLDCTAYMSSLQTSTVEGSIGKMESTSSVLS
jgi:hypothetical protein